MEIWARRSAAGNKEAPRKEILSMTCSGPSVTWIWAIVQRPDRLKFKAARVRAKPRDS